MGYVILESTEYPAMSGSNTICVATVLLETGILPMTEPVDRADAGVAGGVDHGLLPTAATARSSRCGSSTSRRSATTWTPTIEVPDLGRLTVDVAYGGMTYVLVEAAGWDSS